jgi:hypothetical protein
MCTVAPRRSTSERCRGHRGTRRESQIFTVPRLTTAGRTWRWRY